MPADMKLKEETSTGLVLETDPSGRKWAEYLRMLIIPPLLLAGILIFLNLPSWLNWVVIVLAILIETVMILAVSSELVNVTVTIDLTSQRATRIEEFFFVRTKKIELNLKPVYRVLIHCEELGHHCNLFLESPNDPPFNMDFFSVFLLEEKKEISRKIGGLLQKPVILKVTDLSNPISEETIQP